jgi:hypothetical protein
MSEDDPKPKDAKALFAEWKADYAARKAENLGDILDGSGARGQLVEKVWLDFRDLREKLDPGIQALLEYHNVPSEVRDAVQEHMGTVLKALGGVAAEVVKLANVPGAEKAGYATLNEKEGKEPDAIER